MDRRRQEEAPKGAPEWMTTFSDLMNLLLCFFVLLFSMSSVDEEKYTELVASMQSAFSIFSGGATAVGEGILISNGINQLNQLDRYISNVGASADSDTQSENYEEYTSAGREAGEETLRTMEELLEASRLAYNEELSERIGEAIREGGMRDRIDVTFTSQYVQLSLRGAILFDSGKVDIRSEAHPVLDKVGQILERYSSGVIEIEGHTDNIPIKSSRYANNNELSSARALSVFDYLVEYTALDPAHIKHAGRGEYVPVADNSTEAGRAKNRRVEIRIYNPSE